MKSWSKGLMNIYRYLSTFSASLDKSIKKDAVKSNYYSSGKFTSCYTMSNKILELISRKQKIINLKVIIEDALFAIDKQYRRILALIYLDNVKSEMVATLTGYSIRTVFRKKKEGLNAFEKVLKMRGFTEEYFEKLLSSEQWFSGNINKLVSCDEDIDSMPSELNPGYVVKQMIRDLQYVPQSNYAWF